MHSMNGVIVVDKPSGWTSHDVVNKLRRIANTRKIGHLGTLDPLATGVLPLLLNRATRLAQYFTRNDKLYEGLICYGFATDSYDADGVPTGPDLAPELTFDQVERSLAPFQGEFAQKPPPVSAKKIAGKKAYELARRDQPVDLPAVPVQVYQLDILEVKGATARVRIHCGAGTYVRSIAHEAGIHAGCGAHLAELRRLASGPFAIEQARTIEALEILAREDRIQEALVPAASLLPEMPNEIVDAVTEAQIRQGRTFRVSPFRSRGAARNVKALSREGELIAIGEIRLPNVYHPVVVF